MCNHMQISLAEVRVRTKVIRVRTKVIRVHSNSSVINGSLNWFISNYNKIIRYFFQNYSPS